MIAVESPVIIYLITEEKNPQDMILVAEGFIANLQKNS